MHGTYEIWAEKDAFFQSSCQISPKENVRRQRKRWKEVLDWPSSYQTAVSASIHTRFPCRCRFRPDVHKAVIWLRQNKHQFREKVYEPVLLQVRVYPTRSRHMIGSYLRCPIPIGRNATSVSIVGSCFATICAQIQQQQHRARFSLPAYSCRPA
jgi:hypothetical protein